MMLPGLSFFFGEKTPKLRGGPEFLEKAVRYGSHRQHRRLVTSRESLLGFCVGGNLLESGGLRTNRLQIQPRETQVECRKHRGVRREMIDARRILVGQWAKNNHIDDAEDSGVRSNAKSERENRDEREPGAAAQHASRVAKILAGGFHPADNVHAASVFFQQSGVTEAALGVVPSFLR